MSNWKNVERSPGVLLSALKTIAAFLNTTGGTLLIGVSDPGEIKGLKRDLRFCNRNNTDGLEQKIRSLLSDRFDPVPYGLVEVSFETLSDGNVCCVRVTRSSSVIHLDKDVYIRDGNTTRKLDGRALTEWIGSRVP